MKDIKIVSVTYSIQLTDEIMGKIFDANCAKDGSLTSKLIQADKNILSVGYGINESKIFIKLKTNKPKKINSSEKIWQLIARLINQHIE